MTEGILDWLVSTANHVGAYGRRETTNAKEYHQYQRQFGNRRDNKEDGSEDANEQGC